MLSLSDLIAQSSQGQANTINASGTNGETATTGPSTPRVETGRKRSANPSGKGGDTPSTILKKQKTRKLAALDKIQNGQADEQDRKPAAKRKHVDFAPNSKAKEKTPEGDDDSIYKSDNDVEEDGSIGSLNNEPQDYDGGEEYSSQFEKAIEAIYGPIHTINTAPAAASKPSSTPEAAAPPTTQYLETIQEFLSPTAARPFKFISTLESLRPQTKLKLNRKTKVLQAVTETPEEAMLRRAKRQRILERESIKRRWRRRKINYQLEEDIGDAILSRATRVLQPKLQQEQLEKDREAERQLETQRLAQEERELRGDDDDSVQEQQQVLDRLTQQSTDELHPSGSQSTSGDGIKHENADGEDDEFGGIGKNVTVPYRERMDYWNYGRATPLDTELEMNPIQPPRLGMPTDYTDPDSEDGGLRIKIGDGLGLTSRAAGPEESQFFPPTEPCQSARYFHYRLVNTMAARYLCGGVGEDESIENRWIQAMFSQVRNGNKDPLAQFSTLRSLRRVAHQYGCNALLYAKNIWTNPLAAAKALGLADAVGQSSTLAGRRRHPGNVTSSNTEYRKIVLGKYGLKGSEWLHDTEQREDEEDVREDSPEEQAGVENEAVTGADTKTTAMQSTGDKVDEGKTTTQVDTGEVAVGELFSPINSSSGSVKSGATIENPAAQAAVKEALLCPRNTFAHIPGTSPASMSFPLDATGVVYGPVDRHARYFHQEHKVIHASYELTLGSLIARTAHESNTSKRNEIQQQIQALVEEYVEVTQSQIYKLRVQMSRGKLRDVPLVQQYRALCSYCSVWANGFPAPNSNDEIEPTKEESDDVEDGIYTDDRGISMNVCTVADHLSTFLEKRIRHNGLQRFSSLRVTYALALICRKLPEGAAEILSRPMDDNEYPTPLHIVRRTLEYMESAGAIQSNKSIKYLDNDELTLRAGELEYMMYEAAKLFQSCVKADSTNIDNHLWRIAALAACFLLCSGNEIGSEARRFPSIISSERHMRAKTSAQALKHEIRPKLPKFEEVRAELAMAIRPLFVWARHQEGSRLALALTSLLEWNQVIALLAGDKLDRYVNKIAAIHQYHTLRQALLENSIDTKASVTNPGQYPEILAVALENDPSNLRHWRALVASLGSVGRRSASAEDDAQHRAECPECGLLHAPLIGNHSERESMSSHWWGAGREWWVAGLLQMRAQKQKRNQSRTEAIMRELEKERTTQSFSTMTDPPHGLPDMYDNSWLEWLPNRSRAQKEAATVRSNDERIETFDSQLPQSINRGYFPNEHGDASVPSTALEGKVSPKLEVFCYRIAVCCHLKGVNHPLVEEHVHELLKRIWDNKKRNIVKEREEFQALIWLDSYGINIPKMCREKYPKRLRQPLKN